MGKNNPDGVIAVTFAIRQMVTNNKKYAEEEGYQEEGLSECAVSQLHCGKCGKSHCF